MNAARDAMAELAVQLTNIRRSAYSGQEQPRSYFLGADRCAILWACAWLTTRARPTWAAEESAAAPVEIEPALVARLTGQSEKSTRVKMRGLASQGWLVKTANRPVRYAIDYI